MSAYTVEVLETNPAFDLELFMSTSQETRLGGDIMDKLSDAWDQWVPYAHAKKITIGEDSYLLGWLDTEVEDAIDELWESTPSEAFFYNALAQVMCMGIIHDLLPEVETEGCAAAPEATDALADALEAEGIPYMNPGEPGLVKRYAVLTYYPFKGGCTVCSMQKSCPKGSGQTCSSDGPQSVELPGFEK